MSDNPSSQSAEATHKSLFMSLVLMMGTSAMHALGKLVDPETNKAEINLEGAQISIDMLSMLETKTQGQLDDDEKAMLADTLSSLQMNFVETSQSMKSDTAHAAPDTPDSPAEPEQPKEEPKDPIFRKSYGETGSDQKN